MKKDKDEAKPYIRYLDSVNENMLFWPRALLLYSEGDQIKAKEDFDRGIYYEWSLYAISRRNLKGKEETSLTSQLTSIMTDSEEYIRQREDEGRKAGN